jgi:microsomal dipeptidase-like Zn-dependent dipeptidase/MoaA/NifB/PqqE/SkfB family radical SAM enzyme
MGANVVPTEPTGARHHEGDIDAPYEYFFVHTHSLPQGIDPSTIRGIVVVVERSPDRLRHYYDRGLDCPSIASFLSRWPSLGEKWRLPQTTDVLISLEGYAGEFDLVKNLESYRGLGLRIVQPCHWASVPYAEDGRLSQRGRELLRELDRLRMVLDVSHMDGDLLAESVDVFNGEVLASHVVSRALLNSKETRSNSLSKADLHLLADRSALVGVPFVDDLVSMANATLSGGRSASLGDVANQVLEIVGTVGEENVAYGPDYFDWGAYSRTLGMRLGVVENLDWASGLRDLCRHLRLAGVSREQVSNIACGNARRFFASAVEGTSTGLPRDGSVPSSASPWTFQRHELLDVSMAAKEGLAEAPAHPTHAWLTLSNYCNLSCLHCRRRYRDSSARSDSRDTPDRLWQAITEELVPGLESLIVGGNNNSEVTCANRFGDLVAHLSSIPTGRPRLSLQTNGSPIPEEVLEQLVNMDTVFNISVEGGTNETTARIRGIPLEALSRRVVQMNALRSKQKSLARIVLSFTAMRSNVAELPDLVEFAERNGVDEVNVMYLLPATAKWNCESPIHDISATNAILDEAYRLCEYWHVKLLAPRIVSIEQDAICERPWYSVSVNGDGDVRFCCLEDAPVVGNLVESHLAEIWQSRCASESRATVNCQSPLGECGACVLRNLPVVSQQSLLRQLAK